MFSRQRGFPAAAGGGYVLVPGRVPGGPASPRAPGRHRLSPRQPRGRGRAAAAGVWGEAPGRAAVWRQREGEALTGCVRKSGQPRGGGGGKAMAARPGGSGYGCGAGPCPPGPRSGREERPAGPPLAEGTARARVRLACSSPAYPGRERASSPVRTSPGLAARVRGEVSFPRESAVLLPRGAAAGGGARGSGVLPAFSTPGPAFLSERGETEAAVSGERGLRTRRPPGRGRSSPAARKGKGCVCVCSWKGGS